MKQGQHRHNNNRQQQRGRGGRPGGGGGRPGGGGGNPVNRVYESNGPDLKVRGTAQTIAEKYQQLARDAHTAGDPVMAESYYQHAEHYLRILAAAQAFNQQNMPQQHARQADEGYEDEIDTTETGQPQTYAQPGVEGDADQPAMASQPEIPDQPMFTPPPPRENRGQYRDRDQNRDNRERDNREPRGDRPRRFDDRRPQRDFREPRAQDDQPVVGDDGWTGPQPSFLKRPVPLAPLASVTPVVAATEPAQSPEAEATAAPRARRAYVRKAPAEAAEASAAENGEPE